MAGASGDTTLSGTSGSDNLVGGSGSDTLSGGAGSDTLNGGSGSDILDGGSGADRVLGGSGADTLIYRAWENLSSATPTVFTSYDIYDGGNGSASGGTAEIDTLVIYLSNAQMSNATFMAAFTAEWAQYQALITASLNKNTGQASQTEFTFKTINLRVSAIEKASYALDPRSPDAVNDTAATNEDQAVIINVLGSDTDGNGQTLTITHINGIAITAGGPGVAISNGMVTLGADGQLTFTPNANYNGPASFNYTVRDPDGLTDTATVNLTVNSVNDAPSGADKTVTTNEDTGYVFAAADFGFSDSIDGNGFLAVRITTLPSAGTLKLNGVAVTAGQFVSVADISAGKLVFTPSQDANGNAYASFTFQVQDNGGTANGGVDLDQSPNTITVNVTPVNDAPVIAAGNDSGDVGEDGDAYPLIATGNLDSSDVDVGDDPAWSAGPASYGSAAIDPVTGEWSYTLDDSLAAVQGLGEGDVLSDSFVVTVTDEDGLTDTVTVNITITGNGDAPALSANLTSHTYVDTSADNVFATLDGQLTTSDVDVGDSATYSIDAGAVDNSLAGFDRSAVDTYGKLYLNSVTGAYRFIPNDTAIEALKTNASTSFILRVTDDAGASDTETLTISITGANDTPSLTASVTSHAYNDTSADDSFAAVNGQLTTTDRDAGDSATYSIIGPQVVDNSLAGFDRSQTNTYGTLYLNSTSGAYRFVPNDAAIEGLTSTTSTSFQLSVTDASTGTDTKTLAITLNGANDLPTIGGTASGSVTEDTGVVAGNLSTSGALTISDRDLNQSSFQAVGSVAGSNGYGTFTLAANGSWTYAANNSQAAIQNLNTGQSLTDSFTAVSVDGTTTQVVTVTINGVNEPTPAFAANDLRFLLNTATENEGGGGSGGQTIVANADLGTFQAIGLAGTWTFTLDNAGPTIPFQITGNHLITTTSLQNAAYVLQIRASDGTSSVVIPVTFTVGTNGTNTLTLGNTTDLGFGIGGNDTITGGDGNDSLSGGSNSDTINGGAGSDVLWGASSDDTLIGGLGADVLTGGSGNDFFDFIKVGSDNDLTHYGIEQIGDFAKVSGNTDKIRLDDALFVGVGAAGTLNASFFKLSTGVLDADDRIIYNQSTGALYYDADGSGSGSAAVQFAQLTAGVSLANTDFVVI